MKPNVIIRASAGTGKTFSLATRFIRLMLFQHTDPKTIVALTFSRAAAREIYTKLLERLWSASLSPDGAAKERAILLQGLMPADKASIDQLGISFAPETFASLLRRVVDAQDVGAIATLDSFILRIVRSFPLEMGFQHAVEVLDEFGEKTARRQIGEEMLAVEDDADGNRLQELKSAFRVSQRGQFRRTCQAAFEQVLDGWHAFLVDHPEARDWTVDSMCAALGIPATPVKPDLSPIRGSGKKNDPIDTAALWLNKFTDEGDMFPKNKGAELMRFLMANPGETVFRYVTDGGQERSFDCGVAGAAAIRAGVRWMAELMLRRQFEIIAAKLTLCRLFEADYDAATRRRGQLTFADFTHCQAFAEGGTNPLALENIQYRFDERFTHWALDEFQDTSKLQWICLKRLVQEAAGGEQRSVMVVGDLKQSIYGWRGGDDGPFHEVMSMPEFGGDLGESLKNDISYRYEKHTADFINRVFGLENLRGSPLLNGSCAQAVEAWLSSSCWMTHKADVYGAEDPRAGQPKDRDYIEIVRVADEKTAAEGEPDDEDNQRCSVAMKALAPKIGELVKDLWARHESTPPDRPSSDTIGILVRTNADGAYLAEHIRALPDVRIPVVWEGVNGILNAPVVQAVLELLKLAAHPEDTFAWTAVNRLYPLREMLFPELTTAADVSRKMGEMLTRLGLSRTLRSLVSKLTDPDAGLSARSIDCLEALMRLAVSFEAREESAATLEDFPRYLAVSAGRDVGDSSRVVRILTIHRAKGLTLDHVIVPILEKGKKDSILTPDRRQRLEGEGWVLESASQDLMMCCSALAEAYQKKADEHFMEQLRLYYVALTRARKSTYVFVIEDAHAPVVQFRDLLLAPFVGPEAPAGEMRDYGEVVFADGTPFNFARPSETTPDALPCRPIWSCAAGSPTVHRRTPSATGTAVATTRSVRSMATFFSKNYGAAAKHGIDVHADYAAIEWIDPAAPQSNRERAILACEFRSAFVKPSPEAVVWRERGYELFDAQTATWETGQFDRVVFTGGGDERRAIIYDFKTNARSENVGEAQFVENMRQLYTPQMMCYRHALSRLTGLPLARIAVCLLLEATGKSCFIA